MSLVSDNPKKLTVRWWVLVNRQGNPLCIRKRRQSCIRFALDSHPDLNWPRIKRMRNWRIVRCQIVLEE